MGLAVGSSTSTPHSTCMSKKSAGSPFTTPCSDAMNFSLLDVHASPSSSAKHGSAACTSEFHTPRHRVANSCRASRGRDCRAVASMSRATSCRKRRTVRTTSTPSSSRSGQAEAAGMSQATPSKRLGRSGVSGTALAQRRMGER